MINLLEVEEKRKQGLVEVINIQDRIKANQGKRHGTYEISSSGKVSYDLSQSKMINDVLGISVNAAKEVGTWVKGTLWDNPIEYDPSLSLKESLSKAHEQMEQRDNEIKEFTKPFREKAKAYKESIDNELSNEVSATQSFVAGMAIHTLRQGLDIRQWPGLYVSSLTGGIAGQVAGKSLSFLSPGVAQRVGAGIGRFAEEFGEELTDQYTTGEINIGSAVQSGLGAVVIGEVPGLFKTGAKKISKAIGLIPIEKKAVDGANVDKAIKQGQNDYMQKTAETGNEAAVKTQDLDSIAKNTEVHAAYKGKTVNSDKIIKAGTTVEGVTVKTANEVYLPKMARYIIGNKMIKGVKNDVDFINSLKKNPKAIKDTFRKVARRKDLPEDIKEAAEWFSRVFDKNRIKDIDVDAAETINATFNALDGKQEYEPMFQEIKVIEKGYPFEETEIDKNAFAEKVGAKVKHNSRDYKRKVLETDLAKDLNIPKGAKILKVNGNIPKTKVPIITGADYDGNAVTGRSKWIKHTPEADIEYEYNGYRYYSRAEIVDGKWRGDIYKTRISGEPEVKTETPKAKIKQADNIMEDIHGTYNTDETEKALWQDMKKWLTKKFALFESAKDTKSKTAIMERVIKSVGETARKKHNLKSLDEAVEFYKKRYDLDFEFIKGETTPGAYGETKRVTINGKPSKIIVSINKDIADDLDFSLGVLKHELEHLRDFKDNPNFKSTPYTFDVGKEGESLAEYFDRTTKGHFSRDGGAWWEMNYIIHNEIDNLFSTGELNKVSVERLGLDMIPKDLDENDTNFIKGAIEDGKGEDTARRLKKLKTQLNNYFTLKRGLKEILNSSYDSGQKAAMAKDYLWTNLILPFQNAEQRMQNAILKTFDFEYNGNRMNPEKVLDLFEENNGNLVDVLFYDGEIPKELLPMKPHIDSLRTSLNKIVDELQDKSIATRDDIINTLCYDRNLTVERLLPEEELKKYIDGNKNFDIEKFTNGKTVKDELTGQDVPEKLIPFKEKFAELNYKHFNSAVDRLHHEFNRKNLNPERIVKAIQDSRECMTLKDFENTLRKYKAEEIPEVRKFLEEHQNLFQEIENQDIEGNIIKSKKDNARRFFLKDMASIKGTEDNPAFGTFAHKLSRFVDAEYEGYISHQNVSNFVRANKADQRLVISKFVRDVSASYAIKETFPKMGNTGFNVMFGDIKKYSANPYTKTFIGELEGYIKTELGEKLGLLNKPSRGKLDRLIQNYIKYQNKINLSGPKAIKEFGQEPLSMARAQVMLYGGKGFTETYGNIMKAIAVIWQHGELLEKYNKALGSKWKESIPLEFYNIIMDDLNDFTGYRKARLEKYGTNGEKIMAKLDQGLDMVNMYSHTQRIMKLAAYITGGDTMDKLMSSKNLDELFKNNTHYVKKLMRDLEIDDTEYALIKNFKETKSFKELGVFDEVEFKDSLTLEKYSELLGREISQEEFEVLSEATTNKAKKMYDKIVSDISPTETTGAGRAEIEMINDPIRRNFMRLMANFKSSIQEQWKRAVRDYYLSNIDSDTGKFDWSNKIYWKRMMSHVLGTGMALAVISTVSDAEFYADPIESISEKVDDLIANPGSALWGAISENFNLWGLQTGSNVVRRPISFAGQVSKGEWGKAGSTLLKMGIGTNNYNIAKGAYDYAF